MTDTPELKEETPKLITREEYIADIKTRWKIFVKETEAFIEDVKKLVDFIKPYIVKAVDKVKEETPELISREEYIADIKTRWNLFVKEVNAFTEDVKKLIDFIKPYVVKAVDKTKEIYKTLKARFKK